MEPQETVLIVDDERFTIGVLLEVLEDTYHTVIARNGEQALKRARSDTPPDLILLDIVMPGMDGFEVCRQLKADEATQDIPILFVTAMDEVGDEAQGLALGAIDYITKPISPSLVKLRVANHLKLKRQNDLLRNLATRDGLTGIPNRRRFDGYLEQVWARAIHARSPVTAILMDIDFFKLYNDGHGHAAGDDCLRQVAEALHGAVDRGTHLVARYGGEEFVALLPDTGPQEAERIGENLRRAVADLGLPHGHSQVAPYVTVSLGAFSLLPETGARAAALVQKADENLYGAKALGRNRLVASSQLAPVR